MWARTIVNSEEFTIYMNESQDTAPQNSTSTFYCSVEILVTQFHPTNAT